MKTYNRTFALNVLTLCLFPLYTTANAGQIVNDGTTQYITTDSQTTADRDSALTVTGQGSQAITNPGLTFSTTGIAAAAVNVGNQGQAVIDQGNVNTTGSSSYGVYATDSTVTVNKSTIATSGATSIGVSGDNSALTIGSSNISTSGTQSTAVKASGGTLTINETDITVNGSGSQGIAVSNKGIAQIGDTNISVTNAKGGSSLYVTGESVVVGDNLTVKSNSSNMAAVHVGVGRTAHSELTLTDSSIDSGFIGVRGMGADITLNNVNVTTTSSGGIGLDINMDANAVVNGGKIITHGTSASGVWLAASDTTLDMTNSSILTDGNNSVGLNAQYGVATVRDTTINTSGVGSRGITTENTVNGERVSVETTGRLATGVLAANGGSINLTDSSVVTRGDSAQGVYAAKDSEFTGQNVTVDTYGNDAFAVQLSGGTVNLTDSVVQTHGASDVIFTKTGNNNVNLNNTTINPINGLAVSVKGSGTVIDLVADNNSEINGDVISTGYDNSSSISLTNGSKLDGIMRNISTVGIDNTSLWVMNGDSNVGSLNNDGLVVSKVQSTFNTLTVDGDLTGSGTFSINTELGDDNSLTDKIDVKGNATGNFKLLVNNTNGQGALTDVGIPVIHVAGDTSAATVTQSGTIAAGNYEYFVNKGNEHNWYLQSSYVPVPVPDPEVDPEEPEDNNTGEVVPPVSPTVPETKAYRPEIAGYVLAPYMNTVYGFNSVGTYHEREGSYQTNSNMWGRVYGRHDRYGTGRFTFANNTTFVQLGGDVFNRDYNDGWHIKAGPSLTLGHQRGVNYDEARQARTGLSTRVGETQTSSYGIGGYATAWNDDGSYIDTVLQGTRYNNHFSSITDAKMTSYGMVLSVEAGKPYQLTNRISVEPQAQIMGQYLNTQSFYASGVEVESQRVFAGKTRGGLRVAYTENGIQPYVQLDVVQQLGATPSSVLNGETIGSTQRKGYWQSGIGITTTAPVGVNLYADVKYARGFNGGYEGYTGNIGIKYQF